MAGEGELLRQERADSPEPDAALGLAEEERFVRLLVEVSGELVVDA